MSSSNQLNKINEFFNSDELKYMKNLFSMGSLTSLASSSIQRDSENNLTSITINKKKPIVSNTLKTAAAAAAAADTAVNPSTMQVQKIDHLLETNVSNKHKSLIKFIYQWRNEDIEIDDPKLEIWLKEIAPSCVYFYGSSEGFKFYKCALCPMPFTHSSSLIRHYREQHVDWLPNGIFGKAIRYECEICMCTFKRKEHLVRHLVSIDHFKRENSENSNSNLLPNDKNKSLLLSYESLKTKAKLLCLNEKEPENHAFLEHRPHSSGEIENEKYFHTFDENKFEEATFDHERLLDDNDDDDDVHDDVDDDEEKALEIEILASLAKRLNL